MLHIEVRRLSLEALSKKPAEVCLVTRGAAIPL